MAYGTSDYLVKAPGSVGMSRGKPTLVRFVDPQSRNEVRIRLLPKVTKAKIKIGPQMATWPQDRVSVDVQLHDGAGQPLSALDKVQAQVSINERPVSVRWKLGKSRMSTTVPRPTSGTGPWVVRVEVVSALGEQVGRDFLEVAVTPKSDKRPRLAER
jgi:hypothetical protein